MEKGKSKTWLGKIVTGEIVPTKKQEILLSFAAMGIMGIFSYLSFLITSNAIVFIVINSALLLIFLLNVFYIVFTYYYKKYKIIFNDKKIIREVTKKELNFIYYRDKVREKSPAVLNYCFNKKVNYKNSIVATLLTFELRKMIEISDNKIKLLSREDNLLNNNEKYIMDLLKDNSTEGIITLEKLKELLKKREVRVDWEKELFNDISVKGYYKKHTIDLKFMNISIVIMCILFLIELFLFSPVNVIIGIVIVLLFNLTFGIIKNKAIIGEIVSTKEGIELNRKLIGLNKFLDDFSIMSQRGIEEIKIWDYYLIYYLIFNGTGKYYDKLEKRLDIF